MAPSLLDGLACLASALLVVHAAGAADVAPAGAAPAPAVGGASRSMDLHFAASWELGFAGREFPGCRCSGVWEVFRDVLNWTLAHVPGEADGGSSFGDAQRVDRLCNTYAEPLILASMAEGGLQATARLQEPFDRHACTAGLATAFALCAASHARLAWAQAREAEGELRRGESDAAVEAIESSNNWDEVNWQIAFSTWLHHLPSNCDHSHACLAYLDAFLAAAALRGCGHCLEGSLWPVEAAEISENAIRWLRLLHLSPRMLPPPRWRGPAPAARVRQRLPVGASGVFAGILRNAPDDASGASGLVHGLSVAWAEELAATEGPSSGLAAKHFSHIFGPLLRPWEFAMRGPLNVRVKAHAGDFAGPRAGLKFFVYELPGAAHGEPLAVLHGRLRESVPFPSVCDFALSPCTELRAEGGAFAGYRPYAGEATFLAKLLDAPVGVIVDDPAEATFFVVPFLSSTWCFLGAPKCWVRCGGQRPLNVLRPLLRYYNASTAHRHLFLGSDSTGDLPTDLQMQPTMLSYGPNPCDGDDAGHVIMPAPVTDELPLLGPREFLSKDLFAFAADGIGGRPFRLEAIGELERWQQRFPHLFVVARRATQEQGRAGPDAFRRSSAEWAHEMRRAVFCPVLPGDNTFRMRLFHAVLAGCVPVVILFPGGSWYRNHGPSVERSLPFTVRHHGRQFVNWRGLAVELPHYPEEESFGAWAKRLVPSLLQLEASELQERQRRLAEAAAVLRWDFGGTRPDAFTALLDELVARTRAPALAALECFDPRERFGTNRSISGALAVAREENEIFGIVACCPAPAPAQIESCDIAAGETCVRFVDERLAAEEFSPSEFDLRKRQRANMRSHLKAMFDTGHRFDEVVPEDDLCR